jgi:hypothetical protein
MRSEKDLHWFNSDDPKLADEVWNLIQVTIFQ